MRVDASEVHRLAADLAAAGPKVRGEVAKSVSRGAGNIKDQLRAEARSSGYYKHFHRSITYDKYDGGLAAEIGPDKERPQGALGNILYFGTSNNAPELPNPERALEREAPRFERAVADIAEDIL